MNHPADFPTYKPSVFYFRKSLRESTTRDRAITVARVVCHEFEQLRLWAGEQGILSVQQPDAPVDFFRSALAEASSHAQAIILGMFVSYELEQLKALVRRNGLIPPKWIVDDLEAEEKGWR